MKSGEGAKLEDSEEERLKKEEAFKQVRKRQLALLCPIETYPAPSLLRSQCTLRHKHWMINSVLLVTRETQLAFTVTRLVVIESPNADYCSLPQASRVQSDSLCLFL